MSRTLVAALLFTFTAVAGTAQHTSEQIISPQKADTWSATDQLGRALPLDGNGIKPDRHVGLFYFLWLGAHGHDQHTPTTISEGIHPKTAADTASPYDITKILEQNPDQPKYGPELAFHHWGEPYFGYYLSDDEWVIMKHAQLLSDAGVDVLVFDVTNSLAYLPQVFTLCKIFSHLQEMGWSVPKVAFLTNTKHAATTEKIYEGFYKPGHYEKLWFYWKGKPLLMGNNEGLSTEIQQFFNFRRSWAWTEGQEWFGDGKDKWPWIDHYPQNYGWHESPDQPEQITVASAQHPISNIGRSYHNGQQPPADKLATDQGLFFEEQWKRAHEVDPEFVFITGWNEWVAMRFSDGRAKNMMGKPIEKGEVFFVDQYNEEFSRDIEPLKGGFQDNYYYQMISNIRKYKGARPGGAGPALHPVKVDGDFSEWQQIEVVYTDHQGDAQHRFHPGWGRIEAYSNYSGRYDLTGSRVAESADALYWQLESAQPFRDNEWPVGLQLFIQLNDNNNPDWEGYQFLIQRPENSTDVQLFSCQGGWKWEAMQAVSYKVSGKQIELSVQKDSLDLKAGTTIEFKWADNVHCGGDIMKFYDQGDVAPNARFNYLYQTAKP
jgi:hypothetical protein